MMGAFDEGGRYVPTREDCQLARPVGGDAPVPAGPTDAQAQLREELARTLTLALFGSRDYYAQADELLALPTVRAALAAQEKLRRVEALAETLRRERLLVEQIPRLAAAERILGALAGDR